MYATFVVINGRASTSMFAAKSLPTLLTPLSQQQILTVSSIWPLESMLVKRQTSVRRPSDVRRKFVGRLTNVRHTSGDVRQTSDGLPLDVHVKRLTDVHVRRENSTNA